MPLDYASPPSNPKRRYNLWARLAVALVGGSLQFVLFGVWTFAHAELTETPAGWISFPLPYLYHIATGVSAGTCWRAMGRTSPALPWTANGLVAAGLFLGVGEVTHRVYRRIVHRPKV